MSERNTIKVTLGATSADLVAQLNDQGHGLSAEHAAAYQRDIDAVTRLYVRGLLSESQCRRVKQKVLDRTMDVVHRLPPAVPHV